MESLDIIALCGLGWLYDKVEDRYGQMAAFVVTLFVGIAMLVAIVAALIVVL